MVSVGGVRGEALGEAKETYAAGGQHTVAEGVGVWSRGECGVERVGWVHCLWVV